MNDNKELKRCRRFVATANTAALLTALLTVASVRLSASGRGDAGLGLLIGAWGFTAILGVMAVIAADRARKARRAKSGKQMRCSRPGLKAHRGELPEGPGDVRAPHEED